AAGNLGADALREAARALELAAAQGRIDLGDLLHQLDERASIVFRSIESLRAEPLVAHPATNSIPTLPEQPALPRLLEKLSSALREGDFSGSSEKFQELKELRLPEEFQSTIARLQALIESYEYDHAAELADLLRAGIPSGEKA